MISNQQQDALTVLAEELLKLEVPPDCLDGVRANLSLLSGHARILEAWLEQPAGETP